jgi:hypothetical protein
MKIVGLVVLALLAASPAFAACPAGQSEMLTARLYFGQSMHGRAIAPAAWREFLARTVTPRFPSGFTVYDAQGQWRDTQTRTVTREASKVVEIIGADSGELRDGIEAVRKIYIARFHQQSVGLLTFAGCGTF